MKTKKLLVLIPLLVFLSLNLGAQQDPQRKKMEGRHMSRGMHWWWNDSNFMEKLNLSDSQIEKMKALKTKSQKEMIRSGASLSEKMIDLHDEMANETLNESNIKNLIDEITKIQTHLFTTRLNTHLESVKILTPQQRKKLNTFLPSGPPPEQDMPHD